MYQIEFQNFYTKVINRIAILCDRTFEDVVTWSAYEEYVGVQRLNYKE